MASVIGLRMVGSVFVNGTYDPGWGIATMDDGSTIYIPDNKSKRFNDCLDYADKCGADTKRYRERLDIWVKTGKMPPAENK